MPRQAIKNKKLRLCMTLSQDIVAKIKTWQQSAGVEAFSVAVEKLVYQALDLDVDARLTRLEKRSDQIEKTS